MIKKQYANLFPLYEQHRDRAQELKPITEKDFKDLVDWIKKESYKEYKNRKFIILDDYKILLDSKEMKKRLKEFTKHYKK